MIQHRRSLFHLQPSDISSFDGEISHRLKTSGGDNVMLQSTQLRRLWDRAGRSELRTRLGSDGKSSHQRINNMCWALTCASDERFYPLSLKLRLSVHAEFRLLAADMLKTEIFRHSINLYLYRGGSIITQRGPERENFATLTLASSTSLHSLSLIFGNCKWDFSHFSRLLPVEVFKDRFNLAFK